MQFYMMTLLDVLSKIVWVDKIFYARINSLIFLSGVQEKTVKKNWKVSFGFTSAQTFLSSIYIKMMQPVSFVITVPAFVYTVLYFF